MNSEANEPFFLSGIGVGDGCAMGRLVFFERYEKGGQGTRAPLKSGDEPSRLRSAIETVRASLSALQKRARECASAEEAEIFEVHEMLLEDADLRDAMESALADGKSAEDAVEAAFSEYEGILGGLSDTYLRERVNDLRDLSSQLLNALSGRTEAALPTDAPYLLAARDLYPSQTVKLDRSMLLGLVMAEGSATSHTAILARAMGIPALVGVGTLDPSFDGAEAILDAGEGTLCISPDGERKARYLENAERARRKREEETRKAREVCRFPAVTAGGRRILVYANVGDGHEAKRAEENGAEGIGLLRSELLYLAGARYPTEEELTPAYEDTVSVMKGKRVVIRTLDIGADKQAPYFSLPEEENPALGFRGIRVSLARPELFKTQLRAILRASAHGTVSLMLPMIVSAEEVLASRALLKLCMEELRGEGIPFDEAIEVGVMIETPAAAILAREIAREVDFFSVGTNDLTQYTLAADRQNPLVAHLWESNGEPILRLVAHAAREIHNAGGWIGICGELASDFRLTQRFADMGIDELSVSVPYLSGLRRKIAECN